MHKIAEKEFTLDDFSTEHLIDDPKNELASDKYYTMVNPMDFMRCVIGSLNVCREYYLQTKDKKYWWQMIQLLPSSYSQRRTVMMNYEVLANIYKSRKDHKLDEWSIGFMEFIKSLPYYTLITE